MAAEGVSILVVEQFARIVLGVADRAAVMVRGRIVHEGLPAEIEATLSESYLGAGETEHDGGSGHMIEQPARVEQFQQEIDAMQLRDPAVTRERNLLRLGGILMVVGIVVAAGAYVLDRSAEREQRPAAAARRR